MKDGKNDDILELEDRPYLDFYKRYNISPVSQDVSDIQRHFSRRRNLYRCLGLLPLFFKNKRVLELGPGSGHNAIYTNSLKPAWYTLVDGNPIGLKETKAILERYSNGHDHYEIIESLIEEYRSEELFDIVLCEGLIPYQYNAVDFLKHVASFVNEGGVLVITSMDSVGSLSEILRQMIRVLMVDEQDPIERQLEVLRPIYKPHLATLAGMSRPIDDWILDSMIQPITGDLMSMEEAINALGQEFDVYGSSPKIFTDWRWYKDIHAGQERHNDIAIDTIRKNIHNLMDYRYAHPPQAADVNGRVARLCEEVFKLLKELETDKSEEVLYAISENLTTLSKVVNGYSFGTSAAMDDFISGIEYYLKNKNFPELKTFAPFFGRGQQYLSFTRKIQ